MQFLFCLLKTYLFFLKLCICFLIFGTALKLLFANEFVKFFKLVTTVSISNVDRNNLKNKLVLKKIKKFSLKDKALQLAVSLFICHR